MGEGEGFSPSGKSSEKTKRMTGAHWPGNADGREAEPDMRDMDEEWWPVRLPGGEIEEEEEENDKGVIWVLMNGERACLAACSTRNFFKISVSNRRPSWRNTTTWQT